MKSNKNPLLDKGHIHDALVQGRHPCRSAIAPPRLVYRNPKQHYFLNGIVLIGFAIYGFIMCFKLNIHGLFTSRNRNTRTINLLTT